MRKVSVSVPGTLANLGAGLECLALALNLRATVELWEIHQGLEIDLEGEAAETDRLPRDATNLIVRAAEMVFEKAGRRPAGLRVHAINTIPLGAGLGASTAAVVGGLTAANALIDGRLSREAIWRLAYELDGQAHVAAAALFGGLALVSAQAEELMRRSPAVPPLKVVVAVPAVQLSTAAAREVLPEAVPLKDAIFNLGHVLLTAQALTAGDFELLQWAMADRLHQPYQQRLIPGYEAAVTEARLAGAKAVCLSGKGPALAALAPDKHDDIARAMKKAFEAGGTACRVFVLPVDRQGVQVQFSVAGTAETRPPGQVAS
jgi:homoserine kinase